MGAATTVISQAARGGRLWTAIHRHIHAFEAAALFLAQLAAPWLLDNADVLGEALGMDLEITEAEHPVGKCWLDLIGIDRRTGHRVIVENQLEGSDHGHLGQLITYAAGTDADNIVWVTEGLRFSVSRGCHNSCATPTNASEHPQMNRVAAQRKVNTHEYRRMGAADS